MNEQAGANHADVRKAEEIGDALLKTSDHWQRTAIQSLTHKDKWRARAKAREAGAAGVMLLIEAKLVACSQLKSGQSTLSKSSRTNRRIKASKTSRS